MNEAQKTSLRKCFRSGSTHDSRARSEKQLSRIISKWEVFFEQLSICLNYLLETFVSGHGALSRQKMDPKKRNGLVILFQMTQGRCESTQRRTQFCRRLRLLTKIRSNRPTRHADATRVESHGLRLRHVPTRESAPHQSWRSSFLRTELMADSH